MTFKEVPKARGRPGRKRGGRKGKWPAKRNQVSEEEAPEEVSWSKQQQPDGRWFWMPQPSVQRLAPATTELTFSSKTIEDVGDVGWPDNEPDEHGSAHSNGYSENNAGSTTDTIGPTVAESLGTKDEGAPVK